MTHTSTEQERAEFEDWLGIKPCGAAHDFAWEAWKAARRAQVVPKGWCEALTELVAAMRKYEMDVDGIAPAQHRAMMRRAELLLAAAPQTPEATVKQQLTVEAAPVQMPEPAGWVYSFIHSSAIGKPDLRVDSITTDRDRAYSEGHSDQFALYTEQQVRELLANHGIQEKQG